MFGARYWTVLICAVLLAGLSHQEEQSPRVKTPLGAIRGYYKVSASGRKFEAYEGVPYAVPPNGKLRFKPPQAVPAWQGELAATKFGSPCLQYIHLLIEDRVIGSEDCLYLNIYKPVRTEADDGKPLPVLFWIHGGAFQFGTGSERGPRFLMDRDIIYININYRLGSLGFLSTEDETVPGNMGLKDQNMALRWVSENIQWFGGDPKKITLGGVSAGGASVHYHYLSPLSSGLFRGGISFSGTTFDCWTQTENALEKAKRLAAIMGCPTSTNKEMVRCLKYRPARALVQATSDFMPWRYNPYTPFGPVVEKVGSAPFINRPPVDIVTSGDVQDVPWITSVVSEEGLYPAAEFVADKELMRELDENWSKIAPHLLDFNYTLPQERHSAVAERIRKHYLGSKKIEPSTAHPLIKLVGDRLFVVDGVKAARLQAKANKSPVWFYYYTFQGVESLSNIYTNDTRQLGVSHGDDAYRILDTPYFNPAVNDEERAMQQELIDLLVSFVIDGTPKVPIKWKNFDPSKKEVEYLHIAGPGQYSMKTEINFGQSDLWESINFNENRLTQSDKMRDEF